MGGIGDAARDEVRDPRAYLVRIVTRQALNRLRTVARRREDYVGEWLPEPLLTSPDVADDVELAESVSIAMLTVLETLGPAERAVFVLREVFDVPYDEIAEAVGKSPAAVRQIAHRAREHVAARRPRMAGEPHRAAAGRGAVPRRAHHRRRAGPDGRARARRRLGRRRRGPGARRPAPGRGQGAGALALLSRFAQVAPGAEVATLLLNGAVAARIDPAGELDTAITFVVEDGRITRIYAIRNPHKLGRLEEVAELRR